MFSSSVLVGIAKWRVGTLCWREVEVAVLRWFETMYSAYERPRPGGKITWKNTKYLQLDTLLSKLLKLVFIMGNLKHLQRKGNIVSPSRLLGRFSYSPSIWFHWCARPLNFVIFEANNMLFSANIIS